MLTLTTNHGAELEAILRQAPHDAATRLVYADWLEEQGDKYSVRKAGWERTQATRDAKEQAAVGPLHAALAKVDLSTIPVLSTQRCLERTEKSKLLRKLFSRLGLKGISVTAPNYSMAQAVDVKLPKRQDFLRDAHGECLDRMEDPAWIANRQAEATVKAIIARAFPNDEDRSDTQTDYFNYCWSVD